MRRVFRGAGLRYQRLVDLFKLWLRRQRGVLRCCRGRNIFDIFIFQHVGFRRIAVNYRQVALRTGNFRPLFKDHAALIGLDFADKERRYQEAAVGHHRITARNLQRRKGCGPQRQRLGMHDIPRRETETL